MKSPTENQLRLVWLALTALAVAAIITVGVALIWGLGQLLKVLDPVLWPLAVAAIVACLLNPLVDWFERCRVPRVRAIVLVFILAFGLVAAVLVSVIPQVVVETQRLVNQIPDYAARLQQHLNEWLARPPEVLRRFLPATASAGSTNAAAGTTNPPPGLDHQSLVSTAGWLAAALPKMGAWLLGQLSKVASGFGVLVGLALVPVYAFYFLVEKRGIQSHWRDYLPVRDSRLKEEIVFVLDAIKQYLIAFFRGQVLVAICDGTLYTIGFLALGLNYAFLLGFAAMLILIVPFLGAIILCLAALALTLVQYGDWLHPLLVLALFAVVQTLESVFISPKIIGHRVGLHPLVIIVAVMTGTTVLGGLLGGVLAIPLAAALRVIMFRYIWKKREGN
jgi:predicted PurR-regulated permease PerM